MVGCATLSWQERGCVVALTSEPLSLCDSASALKLIEKRIALYNKKTTVDKAVDRRKCPSENKDVLSNYLLPFPNRTGEIFPEALSSHL